MAPSTCRVESCGRVETFQIEQPPPRKGSEIAREILRMGRACTSGERSRVELVRPTRLPRVRARPPLHLLLCVHFRDRARIRCCACRLLPSMGRVASLAAHPLRKGLSCGRALRRIAWCERFYFGVVAKPRSPLASALPFCARLGEGDASVHVASAPVRCEGVGWCRTSGE